MRRRWRLLIARRAQFYATKPGVGRGEPWLSRGGDAASTFSGFFILTDGRGSDPNPHVLDNYDARTVYTNIDTGESFTISGNGLYKDMRLTQIAGTIYRLDAMEVGRPFRVQDSDGN